jgi:hypothetical protein
MPPIVTSAEIERSAAEVFAYATGPARFKEWQKGGYPASAYAVASQPRSSSSRSVAAVMRTR